MYTPENIKAMKPKDATANGVCRTIPGKKFMIDGRVHEIIGYIDWATAQVQTKCEGHQWGHTLEYFNSNAEAI